MKNIILILTVFCFATLQTEGQNFKIESATFETKTNIKEFLALFKTSNYLETYALSITDKSKNKLLYEYSVHIGSVKIEKVNDSTFFLIGSFTFPYADIYASFEIGKHILSIKKNGITIEMDKEFSHSPKLHPETLKDIPVKYNRMKQDINFTNKDWEKVNHSDSVQSLSYELFLGILNGNKDCIPLFQNIRKDFDIINAGAGSEQLMGCERTLELYGYIRTEKQ